MCRAKRAARRPSSESCSIRDSRTFTIGNSAATKKPFSRAKTRVARSRHATPKKSSEGWTSVKPGAPEERGGTAARIAPPPHFSGRSSRARPRRRLEAPPARAQIQHLHEQRERHRGVDVPLRHVLVEALGDEHHAD